jgi:hypothetical protein
VKRDDLKELCLRYLDGDLVDHDASAFSRLVAESPEAARMLARLAIQDTCFESSATLAFLDSDETHHNTLPWFETIAAGVNEPETQHISLRQFANLGGFLLRKALTSKPAYTVRATAAAVLLAVMLFLVFGGNEEDTAPNTLTDQDFGTKIVATLTAERDAAWDRQPGQDLFAGQRLTLTAGFAEITTNRGAVAILEAPCLIEFTESDNGFRLHAGTLVGICERPNSKGFVVATPYMEVTDLGTRFGVITDDTVGTSAHVFEGAVMVLHADHETASQPRPDVLLAGESKGIDINGRINDGSLHGQVRFAAVRPDGSLDTTDSTPMGTKYLDLVDIIAGGDGTGKRTGVGLNAVSGEYQSELPDQEALQASEGRYQEVAESTYPLGVVVPSPDGEVDGLPEQLAFPAMPAGSGHSYGLIWCGGRYPEVKHESYKSMTAVIDGVDYSEKGNRALYLHSNAVVTIDLDAIRKAHPKMRLTQIQAVVGDTRNSRNARYSRFAIGMDKEIALEHVFDARKKQTLKPVNVNTALDSTKTLTLISTDGGDDINQDWIVLGNPRLVLEPITD